MRHITTFVVAAIFLSTWGCNSTPISLPDLGLPDVAVNDLGTPDGGRQDLGTPVDLGMDTSLPTDAGDPCVVCDATATCTVTGATATCTCATGYSGDGTVAGTGCTDDDECTLGSDNCDANATCTNTPGSFTCACDAGYSGSGVTCTNDDECTLGTHDCAADATCTDTPGSFTCACNAGFSGDGVSCVDDNECLLGTAGCSSDATCTNLPGSASCACNPGYAGDGTTCTDVDECADGTDACAVDATCTNTVGAYACACNTGFAGDGFTCAPLVDCLSGAVTCDANATCTAVAGGAICACDPGYMGDGLTCANVDECADGTANCAAEATCADTVGSFTCTCIAGYSGDGTTCVDDNECTLGTAGCSADATCTNLPGSSQCTCNAGFTGDGFTCTDDDECALGVAGCGANASCTNLPGSFACTCDPGYAGDGVTCTDVDECATGANGCDANATCTNSVGAYTCACNGGYVGDGFSCSAVVDCLSGAVSCDANATCTVVAGGAACVCNAGYTGDGISCGDLDECAAGTDTCDANATCSNDVGSFSCACDTGYTGDGYSCADVDECAAGIDTCDANATCTNTVGSYACTCDAPTTGDGTTCACPKGTFGVGCTSATTCMGILRLGQSTGSGLYTVDPDGAGTLAPLQVYCDMDYAGGGWTMLASANVGGYNGTPAGTPSATTFGYVDQAVAMALAAESDTVHIRTAGQPWESVTSAPGSTPILNLRNGTQLYTASAQYQPSDWTGSMVSHLWMTCEPSSPSFPQGIYHACNNSDGLHWLADDTRWSVLQPEVPLQLLVREEPCSPCAETDVCTFDGTGFACADLDECAEGLDGCATEAACTNTAPDYTCACDAGYVGDGFTCTNVDECADGTATCDANATCVDSLGSYACTCNAGFAGDGVTCTDVDECTDGTATCDVNATCTNTTGSYSCACTAPYVGDGTTCACEVGWTGPGCAIPQDCVTIKATTPSSTSGVYTVDPDLGGAGAPFQVYCDMDYDGGGWMLMVASDGATFPYALGTPTPLFAGYQAQADMMAAAGVSDQVHIRTSGDPYDSVTSRPGSIPIDNLRAGRAVYTASWQYDPADWTGPRTAQLWMGCEPNPAPYPAVIYHACGNFLGMHFFEDSSYWRLDEPHYPLELYVRRDPCGGSCITGEACTNGGSGFTCAPFDECAAGADTCAPDATCTDTPTGYTCACNGGYAGDGFTCADVDECAAGTAGCSADATCTNSLGSFTCTCNAGYSGDGITCADDDECAAGTAGCAADATCSNTPGSFSCACNAGFSGDGFACTDDDECAAGTAGCAADATCTNTPGSFTCTCNAGYVGDGSTCADVDECAAGTAGCAADATCTNSSGSFACACNVGYSGDGTTCTDVDECAAGTDDCHATATCTNTVGSFTCACVAPLVGDGRTCACPSGYSGAACDMPVDCVTIKTADPAAPSGTYTVDPDGDNAGAPFSVYCDMVHDGGGWMLLVESNAGASNLTMTLPEPGTPGYLPTSQMQLAAGVSDQVHIRSANNPYDSVTSVAGSLPIMNLRNGGSVYTASWQYQAADWTGPRTGQLWMGCEPNPAGYPTVYYHACGNFTGLHFFADGSSWRLDEPQYVMELYVRRDPCPGTCSESQTCGLSAGTWGCVDLDECAVGQDDCDPNATCTDTVGAFTCACNAGYSGSGTSCIDVNECIDGTANCDVAATCTNTPGGFTCTCNPGSTGDGFSCVFDPLLEDYETYPNPSTVLTNTPMSFAATGSLSVTGYGNYGAGNSAQWFGTPLGSSSGDVGGFRTTTYGFGFEVISAYVWTSNDGGSNMSVGPVTFTGVLPGGGTISETITVTPTGSTGLDYDLVTFDPGIWGGVAILELRMSLGAGVDYIAFDRFAYRPNTSLPPEENECATGTNDCAPEASCTNTYGSFTCACNPGYAGDGRTCADVDECTVGPNPCTGGAVCSNRPGTYACTCASGFEYIGSACVDVDECARGTDDCGYGSCTNTVGGFTCEALFGSSAFGDYIYRVDVETGAIRAQASLGIIAGVTVTNVVGLTYDEAGNRGLAVVHLAGKPTSLRSLLAVDLSSFTGTYLGDLRDAATTPHWIASITMDATGTLYGITGNREVARIYRIDPATAVVTAVSGPLSASGGAGQVIAANPADGFLYWWNGPRMMRLDPSTAFAELTILADMTALPTPLDSVMGAVYDPATDTMIVGDGFLNVVRFSTSGTQTAPGTSELDMLRGMAFAPSRIEAITPTFGPMPGGILVNVQCAACENPMVVQVGGANAPFFQVGPDRIVIPMPPSPVPGYSTVSVENTGNAAGQPYRLSTFRFEYR